MASLSVKSLFAPWGVALYARGDDGDKKTRKGSLQTSLYGRLESITILCISLHTEATSVAVLVDPCGSCAFGLPARKFDPVLIIQRPEIVNSQSMSIADSGIKGLAT
jgi:hypothetical protein